MLRDIDFNQSMFCVGTCTSARLIARRISLHRLMPCERHGLRDGPSLGSSAYSKESNPKKKRDKKKEAKNLKGVTKFIGPML